MAAKERRPVRRSMVTASDVDFNLTAEAVELTATESEDSGDMVTTSLFFFGELEPRGVFVTRMISGL